MTSFEALRGLLRPVGKAGRRIAPPVFVVLVSFGAAIGLGVAASSGHARGAALRSSGTAPPTSAPAADPWTAYADALRQRVQERIDADWAKDRVPGQGKSLTLRIRLKKSGDLDIVEVERPSESIAVDEFAMRTVRDLAPFGPVPVRTQADTVTITASFVLH